MRWLAIASAICIMLLSGCNNTSSNTPSPATTSGVQPLTRIAQGDRGVSVAPEPITISRGQVIFVPVYSHIYHGNKQEQFPLAVTLSIRNTSLTEPITVRSVGYYSSGGKLVKEYANKNLQLAALATTEFFIPQQDSSGGSGASFIVEWVTDKQNVTEPIIEAVMISTSFQQGVSFTSYGRVIQEIKS